ncbi:MAG: hypothetical protein WCO06_06235 [Candidatus Roizmanbacteria bacterium]
MRETPQNPLSTEKYMVVMKKWMGGVMGDQHLQEALNLPESADKFFPCYYIARNLAYLETGIALAMNDQKANPSNSPAILSYVQYVDLGLPHDNDLEGVSLGQPPSIQSPPDVPITQAHLTLPLGTNVDRFLFIPNWRKLVEDAKTYNSQLSLSYSSAQHSTFFYLLDGFVTTSLLTPTFTSYRMDFALHTRLNKRHNLDHVKDDPQLLEIYRKFLDTSKNDFMSQEPFCTFCMSIQNFLFPQ